MWMLTTQCFVHPYLVGIRNFLSPRSPSGADVSRALDDLLKFTSVTGRMAKKVGKPSEL